MAPDARPMIRRVNHIGIIVDDLADARRWMKDVFGLSLQRTVALPEGDIHGEFYACGEVDIEVVEIGDPEMRRRRLGEGNRARVEHIAVEVDDLPGELARLAALGVRNHHPRAAPGREYAHDMDAGGNDRWSFLPIDSNDPGHAGDEKRFQVI